MTSKTRSPWSGRFRVICARKESMSLLQRFIYPGPTLLFRELPHRQVYCPRDPLHLVEVDLLNLVTNLVIILMNSVEIKSDWYAISRVVVVVTAEKQTFRVLGVVVFVVIFQLQISIIHALAQCAQVRAHFPSADQIDLIGTAQNGVP